MKNFHLFLDFILIIFCISLVRDHYKNLFKDTVIKSFNVKLPYSTLAKTALFLSYIFGGYSLLSMYKSNTFSYIGILDIILLISIVTSFYLLLPNKIIFTSKGIFYFHKIWCWKSVYSIDIYDNKIDILFDDFSKKIIELDKVSLTDEKEILQICYNHNSLI